jgi:hypothetical protein
MGANRAAVFCALVIAFASCAEKGGPMPGEGTLGSRVSMRGKITDPSLTYAFRPFTRDGTVKDLFNYLYFEGDTVCFSFPLGADAAPGTVSAVFADLAHGIEVEAERLEIADGRAFGFSLVGSLMEKFFHDELARPAPADGYCCRDIPFRVRCTLRAPGGPVERHIDGAFRIEYRNAR